MTRDNIGIIDNDEYSRLDDVLKSGLSDDDVDRIRIAVGYLYMSGLKRLRPELDEFLDDGGEIQVMMGNQEQKGLEELVEAHQNLNLAGTKFKESSRIRWSEKPELRGATSDNYSNQILYERPTTENQAFFVKLVRWLQDGQIEPRLYLDERFHAKAYLFEKEEGDIFSPREVGVIGSSNLSLSGLHSNTELNAPVYNEKVEQLKEWFDDLWEDSVEFDADLLEVLEESWVSNNPELATDGEPTLLPDEGVVSEEEREHLRAASAGTGLPAPYLVYVKILYELYKESLETAEDYIQSFDVYEDLFEFQKWAVNRGIRIANKYDGVVVSDVVGMGKTFVGLGLMEHFQARSRLEGEKGKMLIICPKHLEPMWQRMVNRRYSFNAETISMGMVSKEGYGDILLQEHDDTTVCLIDEAHHFRNDNTNRYENLERFLPVVNKTILLTATPYTKSPWDVYNQLKLFHLEDVTEIPINPPDLDEFFSQVDEGVKDLSNLLNHVMVRRTRQDIVNQYGETDDDGDEYIEMAGERRYLPERHLQTVDYNLDETYATTTEAHLYDEIIETLENLSYARYYLGSGDYLKESYSNEEPYQSLVSAGRSIRGLIKANLLKRLESSVHAFHTSLKRMEKSYTVFRDLLDEGTLAVGEDIPELVQSGEDIDYILEEIDERVERGEVSDYDMDAFHLQRLKDDLEEDIELLEDLYYTLERFHEEIEDDYSVDDKAEQLRQLVVNLKFGSHELLERGDKAEKLVVFTQFSDTVEYLENAFGHFREQGELPEELNFESVTGDSSGVESVINRFAPEANDAREQVDPEEEIDLLIATDVAGEGINLQDANLVINYDLHWNPLRLIQRIGRVDRLGSDHEDIYAFNFLPETELEEELGIVDKVENRVEEISRVLGEDGDILSPEDELNQSYMEDIYEEADVEDIQDEVNEMLGSDDLVGPASDLQEVKQEKPSLIEWLESKNGIRSALEWDRDYDGVLIVYRQGEYTTPYLVAFEQEAGTDLLTSEKDVAVRTISCPVEEPVAELDAEVFNERYERAVRVARTEFESEMGERYRLKEAQGASKDRDYVLNQLDEMIDEIDNTDQQQTLMRYQDIVEAVAIDRVLNEFRNLREEEIKGDELLDAVVEIISRYNLEERYEDKEEWAETQNQPPHVVAGMYLKGQ